MREAQEILRDRTKRAVTTGYGPRFLHSTGQLHKGGAPIGCFIQLTCGHAADLPIPGCEESFGTLIDAQAAGDFASLETHGLPVARVDSRHRSRRRFGGVRHRAQASRRVTTGIGET